MSDISLFAPAPLGKLNLKNRVVMAPMTRSRAPGGVPGPLMVEYYSQRAGAGLIVTEGTSPSPNGLGYANIPGLFSTEQVEGWKTITQAVHAKSGHIFVQLMHTGRVGHPLNLPSGAEILAPSSLAASGEMFTAQGPKAHPVPRSMSAQDLAHARDEYVQAAKNAIAAGFDGVELHGANGYLLEQFISPVSNQRTDNYGGSIANRLRFVIEVTKAVSDAIGGDRTGIRLSPYGLNGGMEAYPEIDATYLHLVQALAALSVQYIHLVDHSAMGAPAVPDSLKDTLRKAWPRTFITCGGFDRATAETALAGDKADLIAFGRPFLANPDLVMRLQGNHTLNVMDPSTLYSTGVKGYTDYPVL